MPLPLEKTKPRENLEDYIIFLYGIPKIGKSTFASKFSSPLFLATEDGLRSLETFQNRIRNWSEYLNTLDELNKDKHSFRTVVIDTVDNLFLFCNDYVMRTHQIEHASDMEWGKGWELLKNEFRRGIIRATQLNSGLILISHSRERDIRKKGQEPITKITYTLPAHVRELITGFSDMILFITFENKQRVIKTKPSEEYDAGDRTGKLPETISLSYDKFLTAFYSSDNKEGVAKSKLIQRVMKGEATLAELKIDNFDTEKRVLNARKKYLGSEVIENATPSSLQDYVQHLTLKYQEEKKNAKNAKNG